MSSPLSTEQIVDRVTTLLFDNYDDMLTASGNEELIETFKDMGRAIDNGQIFTIEGTMAPTAKRVFYSEDTKIFENEFQSETSLIKDFFNSILSVNELTNVNQLTFNPNTWQFETIVGGGHTFNMPSVLFSKITQWLYSKTKKPLIDPIKAKEILDTDIYELIPSIKTQQDKINDFFKMYQDLKGPSGADTYPQQDLIDINEDGVPDVLNSDTELYDPVHDISSTNPLGFIPRLNPQSQNDINFNQSLEWLRNDLKNYFPTLSEAQIEEGELPEYENKSEGYLKIRNMNQAIIIRKEEGTDIGLQKEVINDICPSGGPSYLCNGFTITMWVKFLDRVNSGTLFNYGNPLRDLHPMGFTLETFIIHKDQKMGVGAYGLASEDDTWGSLLHNDGEHHQTWVDSYGGLSDTYFVNSDYERFIRLVVREDSYLNYNDGNIYGSENWTSENGILRDSHIGMPFFSKRGVEGWLGDTTYENQMGIPTFGLADVEHPDKAHQLGLITHTRVPVNFDEWYFIVASYDPTIEEGQSFGRTGCITAGVSECNRTPDWWNGNIEGGTYEFTHRSGLGNRCKVELISKTDLLRARGFKTS